MRGLLAPEDYQQIYPRDNDLIAPRMNNNTPDWSTIFRMLNVPNHAATNGVMQQYPMRTVPNNFAGTYGENYKKDPNVQNVSQNFNPSSSSDDYTRKYLYLQQIMKTLV
jgi:hypothetical protein